MRLPFLIRGKPDTCLRSRLRRSVSGETKFSEQKRFKKLSLHEVTGEFSSPQISSELGIDPEQVWRQGKHSITVKVRSSLCFWAVRKLGFSASELSKKLGVSQPSVSISVKRGEKIAKAEQLELVED